MTRRVDMHDCSCLEIDIAYEVDNVLTLLVPVVHLLQPLEYRMACVGAASINHLCKSIIFENTRAHPSVDGWKDPLNSKFYVVVVQVGHARLWNSVV